MRERYRRNEDRIISERLFTREDIDEMDNRFGDVEEEDINVILSNSPTKNLLSR